MFILFPVVAAVVLVFLGYAALWSSFQNGIPKGVAQFGKVMSILLYAVAGLVIVGSVLQRPCGRGMHEGCQGMPAMMMSQHGMPPMQCGQGMRGACPAGNEGPTDMKAAQRMPGDKEQMNAPLPDAGGEKRK